MTNLINGDARHIALADESVQCIITSPPYFGLRDYGTARWEGGDPGCDHKMTVARHDAGRVNINGFHGSAADDSDKGAINYRDACSKCGAHRIDSQIGLERVPDCLGWATGNPCGECYVCHIVAVMRECWRVLRSDGVCFLNLGDSYFGDTPPRRSSSEAFSTEWDKSNTASRGGARRSAARQGALKPKDLCLIPSRVALALQASGWWVRSEIIWHKPNPMPESVTDRPTKAHEMIYLLTKRVEYYYDAEAIREPTIPDPRDAMWGKTEVTSRHDHARDLEMGMHQTRTQADGFVRMSNPAGRNKRSVWTVATQPYSGAHYAVFPLALIEPMILAGTSQRGACPTCGKAWRRVVERNRLTRPELPQGDPRYRPNTYSGSYEDINGKGDAGYTETSTLGFAPACSCYGEAAPPLPDEPADTSNGDMAAYKAERARLLNDVYPLLPVVPCKVLDPFSGSGTVLRVAIKHGRIGIGNDLNLNYAPLAIDRTSKIQRVMPL